MEGSGITDTYLKMDSSYSLFFVFFATGCISNSSSSSSSNSNNSSNNVIVAINHSSGINNSASQRGKKRGQTFVRRVGMEMGGVLVVGVGEVPDGGGMGVERCEMDRWVRKRMK